MADTIDVILEFLHRHHFSKAATVLREEVTARQQAIGPLLLNDDRDLEVSFYLKSMQEKSSELDYVVDVTPVKRAVDAQMKPVTEVKQSAQQLKHGRESKEKLHGQVDKLRPISKLEESEPLFMEFEVEDLEHPTETMRAVGRSPLPVTLSSVSKKSLARVGGLGALQTDAELAASSSVEKVVSDQMVVEQSSVAKGKSKEVNVGVGLSPPAYLEKGFSPTQEIDSPQALYEATRGKVDALKQRWEPRTVEKPIFARDKGRAIVPKKMDGQSDKVNDHNGPVTPVQASTEVSLVPGPSDEMSLISHEKTNVHEVLLNKSGGEEFGFKNISVTDSRSLECTDVANKTIVQSMKTSTKRCEGGAEEGLPGRSHGFGENNDSFQSGPGQELVSRVFFVQESGSEVLLCDGTGNSKVEETSLQGLSTERTHLPLNFSQEELPRLPPVRLRSIPNAPRDGDNSGVNKNSESVSPVNVTGAVEATPFGLGSYLDIPVGQDISSSGSRHMSATARPSVSHGIVEDQSELLSGFTTAGDGQSESVDFPDEYWDSDTYEDDDDPGYHRQPIEDEEWFLAHEIDYPSEDERARPNVENPRGARHAKDYEKYDDEDCSSAEDESNFLGEEYLHRKAGNKRGGSQVEVDTNGLFGRMGGGGNGVIHGQVANAPRIIDQGDHNRQLLSAEGPTFVGGDTRWQGFDDSRGTFSEEGSIKKVELDRGPPVGNTFEVEDDRIGSVRFGGVGVSSEVAEFGSERRESVRGESSEGDLEIGEIGVCNVGQNSLSSQVATGDYGKVPDPDICGKQEEEEEEEDVILRYYNNPWASHKRRGVEREASSVDVSLFQNRENEKSMITSLRSNGDGERHGHKESDVGGGTGFAGFSFPSPSTSGGDIGAVSRVDSGKSLWSVRDITGQVLGEEGEEYGNGVLGPDDPLASWRRKSNESSPIISPRNEEHRESALSVRSTGSANSTDGYGSGAAKDCEDGEDDDELEEEADVEELLEVSQQIREAAAVAAEDEEAAAVQEQIRRIRAEEEEFEIFDLKIVHRKNRTGFEEDKDFPVVINAVIAGRYHVTEYLGSAAFSKAIQAHDLHTGMDVCMKIIKNNKDFFDQSLDEIKLLKYINKHDPGDKHHVLRLFDYFYHKEHLFIVCELLRANLYEFHKYNRESGGEVYFTMPRLQSITGQCLEALEFIHGLGLIHCDLKPENILVKSYSRCEIKVIDLGSSCFQTDHLCSYVQSRSYRAPEVILGLPYDQKIDMWSLGCILAELCSGNVLFQNDSLATLLARVVGILGPIDPELLAKGRDTHKFFTKNHTLYERNQDSDQLEYLQPKKTSLAHRLPMGDQGFVDFVGYLLQIDPSARPTANVALKHPWLSYPYEPISS